ncbi:MAG: hypothetical protein JWQ40_2154 [Segetibacter sp.]|nr:hypothetical protein [Segetibacter sp.]
MGCSATTQTDGFGSAQPPVCRCLSGAEGNGAASTPMVSAPLNHGSSVVA